MPKYNSTLLFPSENVKADRHSVATGHIFAEVDLSVGEKCRAGRLLPPNHVLLLPSPSAYDQTAKTLSPVT